MPATMIIAEIGVNHNGDLDTACRMIDEAAACGADAVKFQTFSAIRMVSRYAGKAAYQKQRTDGRESQFDMLKKLEFDRHAHEVLRAQCAKRDIAFLSAPFDLESIELLLSLGMQVFKIPSGEITNLPYLRALGQCGKRIIMSTGMADLDEVQAAVTVLVNAGTPREHITLLHCTTAYPTLPEDVNLRAMVTMRERLGLAVGYSDHTVGWEIPVAAVALGAVVIEKHFTLDTALPGPDHAASLDPAGFSCMVKAIRLTERALGTGLKVPSPSELENRSIARKSIVARTRIARGELLTDRNITAKRPGTGISPMRWDTVIGTKASRDFDEDGMIEL